MLRDRPQPFKMPGFEMEYAALHAPFGAGAVRIETRGAGSRLRAAVAGLPERDTELVREYFLGCAHAVERVGVNDLVELCDQKLIRKDRELNHEFPDLRFVLLAAAEPGGVRVRRNDAMIEKLGGEARPKSEKGLSAFCCVARLAFEYCLQRGRGKPREVRLGR